MGRGERVPYLETRAIEWMGGDEKRNQYAERWWGRSTIDYETGISGQGNPRKWICAIGFRILPSISQR